MELVGRSINGLFQLLGLTVITHAVTFFMTTVLISRVETHLYGFATVQLQLLISTVLFLSREAFRNACQRSAGQNSQAEQQGMGLREWERRTINLSWLVVPVGFIVTVLVCGASLLLASAEERSLPHYYTAMIVTALAAWIELLSEPFYVLTLRYLLFGPRVTIEVMASLVRCFSSVYFVCYHPHMGALAFSYSWLFNSITVTGGYYLWFYYRVHRNKIQEAIRKKNEDLQKGKEDTIHDKSHHEATEFSATAMRDLFPRATPGSSWTNPDSYNLLLHFFRQSFQMYILTEGQKYILKGTQTLVNQALFSIVNNLGSLVARFIFGPVEQISNSLFSKFSILGPKKSAQILTVILKFMILFGITFIAFGPNYSFLLLDILYGSRISSTDAPTLLSFYCVYVLVMAINGIEEAFLRAVSGPNDLTVYNQLLIVFTIIYVTACIVLTSIFNSLGLIFADGLNMILRILYCTYFIVSFFKANNTSRKGKEKEGDDPENFTYFHLAECLPSPAVALSYVASFAITWITGRMFMPPAAGQGYSLLSAACFIGIGGVCLLSNFAMIFLVERKFVQSLVNLWRSRHEA